MKQHRKKYTAMLLALCAALNLTACGGSGGNGGSGDSGGSGKDPLAAAMENMSKVESMDAKMVMEMDMTAGDQTLETVTTIDTSLFTEPMRLKVDMTMDMSGYGDASMEIYAEEAEDGTLVMYQYDGMDWSTQNVTTDDLVQYDVSGSMDAYIASASDFKQEGTEQVGGVSAYKYTGVITGDSMQDVMMSSGALDSLGTQMNMDEAQMEELLSGDIAVTLWIDEENLYPVQYDMDMTEVMDGLMGKILEAAGDDAAGLTMSIPKMTISMTCGNFNSATDFTIPEEAKNA